MRRTVLLAVTTLVLASCQNLKNSRPGGSSGGDTLSAPGNLGLGGGVGGSVATPVPGAVDPTQLSWAVGVAGSGSGPGQGAASATIPVIGATTQALPIAASNFPMAITGSLAVIAGGLRLNPQIGARHALFGLYATASATTFTGWQSGTLPSMAACDLGMGVDGKGRLILFGGIASDSAGSIAFGKATSSVLVGTPDAGGKIAWQPGNALPKKVFAPAVASFNGTVYSVGGQIEVNSGGLIAANTAFIGRSGTDGSITWTAADKFPADSPGFDHAAAVVASALTPPRLFILGGLTNAAPSKRVWSAAINSDGTLEPFIEGNAMPEAKSRVQAAVVGPNLVVTGGEIDGDPALPEGKISSTEKGLFALIGPTGSLTWQAGPKLPQTLQDYALAVSGTRVAIAGGRRSRSAEEFFTDGVFLLDIK